ncbi:hypothetical protein PCC8801_1633 [Rippkaea orientalis PCC 8801]|uniref:DUF29 domain-containing protein n=1 Tax=Rippkaea orientalis (strain PCC 8801 / RF-1) TaxID=41431 RepID=B7JVZ5_RIPO1|nr:hypothetical protein PCC8801_1633 [Rippkaea orientalis PCC 8801]
MISKAFQLLEEQENEIVLPSYIKATNLRNYLADELDIICQDALGFVQQKTGFCVTFPEHCPYTLEQLLDKSWYPIH